MLNKLQCNATETKILAKTTATGVEKLEWNILIIHARIKQKKENQYVCCFRAHNDCNNKGLIRLIEKLHLVIMPKNKNARRNTFQTPKLNGAGGGAGGVEGVN